MNEGASFVRLESEGGHRKTRSRGREQQNAGGAFAEESVKHRRDRLSIYR
jgi:hypothetical protein